MAAVAIAATVVQSLSAQASVVCRLLSHFAHARAARPASLREGMSLPRFDPAAKSCSLEPRPTLPSRPQVLKPVSPGIVELVKENFDPSHNTGHGEAHLSP